MNKKDKLLKFIHFFVGIGAVFGGIGAILNPNGFMGVTTAMLKTGPFKTFMIPGIFIFFIIGVGNLMTGYLMAKDLKFQGYISGILSITLILWILIQCFILQSIAALHIIYFCIGCVQGGLSTHHLYQKRNFPFNLREYKSI